MRKVCERGAIALAHLLVAGGIVVGGAGVGVGLHQVGAFGGGDANVLVTLDAVSTFDCPGGAAIGELHRGDRVLATGREEKGTWIEVRDPRDLSGRVWIAARYLVPDADLAELEARTCSLGDAEDPAAPTTAPGETLPPPVATTTTTQRSGGPAPAPPLPPPAADTTGPAIGAVGAAPALIFTSGGPGACTNTTSLVTVSVSDPSGVQSVSVAWSVPGFASGNGTPQGGGFRVGPQPFSPNLPNNTAVTLTITARDNAGNQSQATNTTALKVSPC